MQDSVTVRMAGPATEIWQGPPLRLYWLIAGRARDRTNRQGMRETLERIKAVVE
ncbi:hypothetical protein [Nocardia goodfellowii]|uniref:Uncharacterized protein n=1 Tax=Nocardia goodfellowii TaxID=882446 RepID=A0ABS4QLF1_9NOCA|nr:hypothetical protein [Nocardia goodfellowii]MBP2192388.1 hypothetical protein [Nocardia goodfellowii]